MPPFKVGDRVRIVPWNPHLQCRKPDGSAYQQGDETVVTGVYDSFGSDYIDIPGVRGLFASRFALIQESNEVAYYFQES
jgi:hypothetical protein